MTLRQRLQTLLRPIVGRANAWLESSSPGSWRGDSQRLPWPLGRLQGRLDLTRPPVSTRRKIASVGLALGAVGAAVALQPSIEQRRLDQIQAAANTAATDVSNRVPMALTGFFTALTDRAVHGAGMPQVEALVAVSHNQKVGRQGARTMLWEFFSQDTDWSPFLQEFPVQAVSFDGRNLDLLVGANAGFQPGGLIIEAASAGQTHGFVPAGAAVLAMGAARIRAPGADTPAVLMLGRPLHEVDLAELGRRTGFALALVDSAGRLVVRHGAEDLFTAFANAPRSGGAPLLAGDGGWMAKAVPLAPGWNLWAIVDLRARATAAAQNATSASISVWCGSVLVAILSLFVGLNPSGQRRKGGVNPVKPGQPSRPSKARPVVARAVVPETLVEEDAPEQTVVQTPSFLSLSTLSSFGTPKGEGGPAARIVTTATLVVQRVWQTGKRNLGVLLAAWQKNKVWARASAILVSTPAAKPAATPAPTRPRPSPRRPVVAQTAVDGAATIISGAPATDLSPTDAAAHPIEAVNALWSVTRASSQSRLAIEPTVVLPAFGRYTLLSELGKGGMARVYAAVVLGAQGFRRKFVVKRLRADYVGDPALEDAFIDEARVAAGLVHSNILPVLDFGKVGAEYFLATEYILGRDLGRLVQRAVAVEGRALSPDVVFFIALELLKALDYAHTKADDSGAPLAIVHRDVSPSNVLISSRGEVKLFDFGIAKAEGRVAARTKPGVIKGNLSFIAPEQARGGEVDARADLFSLALVLHHCLTGEKLYRASAEQRLMLAARGPGPEELERIGRLPPPFASVLTQALAPDPEDRFPSATAFAAALGKPAGRHAGGATALATLMVRLFADELRQEEVAGAA